MFEEKCPACKSTNIDHLTTEIKGMLKIEHHGCRICAFKFERVWAFVETRTQGKNNP